MSRALESRAFAAKAKMFQALESSSSLRGFEKAKAIHNTESAQIDCHALQSKARNDKRAVSSKQGEASQSDFKILDKNAGAETQDSRRQDFRDKNGALRVLRMRRIEIYAAVRKTKQSPFLA